MRQQCPFRPLLLLWGGVFLMLLAGCWQSGMRAPEVKTYVFRLLPGQDLKEGIEQKVREYGIEAGWLVTAVGSLTHYSLRYANQPEAGTGDGHFEIVSLTGTVSINGSHLHLSLSDSTGYTRGGHLMPGCRVYTTAEIVLQSSDAFRFTREKDGTTPWEELQVHPRP